LEAGREAGRPEPQKSGANSSKFAPLFGLEFGFDTGVAIEVCVPQLPFAPPESEAADITISTGEAFYRELSKAGVATKFTDWEIRPTFLTDLRADLDNYEGITGNRDDATQERKDAVSELEGEEEKLIGSLDGLDTLLRNKFQGDKTALARWREA